MDPTKTPSRPGHAPRRGPTSERNARTPRFIFASSRPSSSVPRFVATPRFRFPERDPRASDVDLDVSDAEPFSSAPAEDIRRTGDLELNYPDNHSIEDSGSDEEELLFQDDPTSSPIEGYLGGGDDPGANNHDIIFDDNFPPTPENHKAKRRRISLPPTNNPNAEPISSCPSTSPPPSPPPASNSSFASPTSPFHQLATQEPSTPLPPPSTAFKRPPPSSTKQPRFLFQSPSFAPSQRHNPSTIISSQPRPTTAPTPTQRRQPHFILPSSPSRPPEPSRRAEGIHQPSTTTLLRRPPRRSTTTTPNFIPGGMASSVRGWLLEAEAIKHTSQHQHPSTQQQPPVPKNTHTQAPNNRPNPSSAPGKEKNYHLISEIDAVHHQPAGSGGSAYVPGHPAPATLVTTTTADPASGQRVQKLLLFGAPLSFPPRTRSAAEVIVPPGTSGSRAGNLPPAAAATAGVKRGDRIGVRRGLVWEMEIEEFGRRVEEGDGGVRVQRAENGARVERWVVGVEWDVLGFGGG
ncbi:hypothetical protein FQN50_004158 [Emmonsiellopsis sp. PD_5]|nr:hypothetical protein FQN50_004158 [Emmonsiellopsis sp. PD_5]